MDNWGCWDFFFQPSSIIWPPPLYSSPYWEKLINKKGRPSLVCCFNSHCRQCWGCLVAHWGCNDYDALDCQKCPLRVDWICGTTFHSLFYVAFRVGFLHETFQGNIEVDATEDMVAEKLLSSRTMLFLGLGMIVSVPVFKTFTHLPPYMGMMLALGVVWLVSEYIHPEDFSRGTQAFVFCPQGTFQDWNLQHPLLSRYFDGCRRFGNL